MATASPLPPRLLKDFLQDQITPIVTSTPTPRKTRLIHKATEVFINAVKFQLPSFKSVKRRPPSSILPRSISRRLSRSRKADHSYYCDDGIVKEVSITVKVKDILRLKSFRDLADQDHSPAPEPLDLAAANSHSRCNTSTETSASSGRSSWCDSDFTAEDLPSSSSWCGNETEVKISKKYIPVSSNDLMGTTTGTTSVHQKVELPREEEESYTPVSVLDFSFQEDEESVSPFQQTWRRRFMPKCFGKEIGIQNEVEKRLIVVDEEANTILEEKARELVECVTEGCDADHIDHHHLLLEFFRHELITSGDLKNGEFDGREVYLRVAKAWLRGEDDEDGSLEWAMEGKREVCVREMDRRERWNKFDEEQKAMAMEIETRVLNSLLDELLIDLVYMPLTTDHTSPATTN